MLSKITDADCDTSTCKTESLPSTISSHSSEEESEEKKENFSDSQWSISDKNNETGGQLKQNEFKTMITNFRYDRVERRQQR